MKLIHPVLDFFTSTKVELQKVVWPTPRQTLQLTLIVITVTVTVGFFIGTIDFILAKLFSFAINK